jgi:hypothetical protein
MKQNIAHVVSVNLFAWLIAFIAATARPFAYLLKRVSVSGNFMMNVYARLA